MKKPRTDWDWHWIRLRKAISNIISIPYVNPLPKINDFKLRLEQYLRYGYPIDYIIRNAFFNTVSSTYSSLLQETILTASDRNRNSAEQVINILLDHGANVNVTCAGNRNALMCLAENVIVRWGADEIWQRIIEQTTDINLRNSRGLSAIDIAAKAYIDWEKPWNTNVLSKISLLLDYGAEPREKLYKEFANVYDDPFRQEEVTEKLEKLIAHMKNYKERQSQLKSPNDTAYWDYEL